MAANPSIQLGTDGNWAIKEDNLLAYKQDGTRFFNKEFDFSRSSLATFIDKNGLIKVSGVTSTELVVNGGFDTDSNWVKGNGWTISDSKADFIGSAYGEGISQSGVTTLNKIYAFSCDVIQGSIDVKVGSTSYFPYSGGTIYVTANNASSNAIVIRPLSSNVSIDNVSVVEVQTDVPRIDFKDNTTGHLLLEPQSTNLITYSEDFSDSYWRKDKLTVIPNSITSPTGELNASLIKEISYTSSIPSIDINNPSSLGTGTYTFSFYVKNNNGRYLGISFGSSSERVRTNFDFNTNTFKVLNLSGSTTATASFTTLGNFYRISITATFPSATVADAVLMPLATDTYPFFAFQDSDNRSFYLWGVQVEALPYATSYIPTSGSTVTRNAEVCNNSGSLQDFNSEEGVLYAEISQPQGTLGSYLAISDGNTSNRVIIGAEGGNIKSFITGSGSSISMIYSTYNANTNKVAIKYKSSSASLFYNGSLVSTTSSAPSMSGLSELKFTSGASGQNFYGKVKNIKVFKRALSDAELQKLTT